MQQKWVNCCTCAAARYTSHRVRELRELPLVGELARNLATGLAGYHD